ncbi:MAG: S8 family serine peptidase [Treponema sp.]|nr:S8 family serine peptidase [Treponema sp.]
MKKKMVFVLWLLLPLSILLLQCKFEAPGSGIGKSTHRSTADEFFEKKHYSNASLEEYFTDNLVLVVLDKTSSMNFRPWTPEDFQDIPGIVRVTDLSAPTMEVVQQQLMAEASGDWSKLKERIELGMLIDDVNKFRRILALELAAPGKENVLQTITLLEQREGILYAGPDYFMEFCALPNPLPSQFYGQSPALNGASLPAAWDIINIAHSFIRVGVIDTGIYADHPALANRIDQNLSRDFFAGNQYGGGTPFVDDDPDSHGTPIAGIIAANGAVVIGVCWDIQLVSLKVSGPPPNLQPSAARVITAITYANGSNIPILNLSATLLNSSSASLYLPLYNAIDSYPGLIVCSAGNFNPWTVNNADNDYTERYPSNWTKTNHYNYAELTNLITVGALNHGGTERWVEGTTRGSHYGATTVDLFAPGQGIYTADKNGGYHSFTGTSYATPFVTGVAALVKSLHPWMTAAQLKQIINESTQPVTSLSGFCKTGGKLNADNAVRNFTSNGVPINGLAIIGSMDINFNSIGLTGRFYLFDNNIYNGSYYRTWAIVEVGGGLSYPISYDPLTNYDYVEWDPLPVEITDYMMQSGATYLYGHFNVLVPVLSTTGTAYIAHGFYFDIYSSGVEIYHSNMIYEVDSMLPGDMRKIKVQHGNGRIW